jgi:hypothetical protein
MASGHIGRTRKVAPMAAQTRLPPSTRGHTWPWWEVASRKPAAADYCGNSASLSLLLANLFLIQLSHVITPVVAMQQSV